MLSIASPTEAHAAAIHGLMRGYPYRAHQQRRQGLDADRLAQMLWEQLRPTLANQEYEYAMAARAGEAVGLAGLAPDAWHSGFFGLRMGKIQPLLIYPEPHPAGAALLDSMLNHARRRGYEHLSCRVDASDYAAIQLLERDGFALVDGSQKLSRRLGAEAFAPVAAPPGFSWGPLREGEERRLAEITTASHTTNHFFNDPALGMEAAKRLFEEWVLRCCRGLARHVFVARHDGEPAGFVTYLGASALEKHFGLKLIVLDFVVVGNEWQGRGVGRWLLVETLNALGGDYDMVELRTSFNNYPALALYHRLGFETVAADVILHKLLRDAPG